MIETFTITSLKEYIEIVEDFSPRFSLSRGQEEDFPLLPSALRQDDAGLRLYGKSTLHSFIEDFKSNSQLYIDASLSYHENDWLVHAQHFGVPTQLLDFSYSHLVSLMFALENAFEYNDEDENNSVVWLLNPNALNMATIGRKDIIDLSEGDIPSIGRFEQPFVASAKKNNVRISAQNGLFIYFQDDSRPLENVDKADLFLKKIIIPHIDARNMLRTLYSLGMRFSHIYPELASVSKDIILKHRVLESYRQEEKDE